MKTICQRFYQFSTRGNIKIADLQSMLHEDKDLMVVQIGKEPTTLFKKSMWAGYRNGGMASWLSCLLPHLPTQRFCLYMDPTLYKGSEYMYGYYSEYYRKLFYNNYVGMCVHPRDQIDPSLLYKVDEIKLSKLSQSLDEASSSDVRSVILDFRASEMASKDNVEHLFKGYQNTEYINLPLNDEDLVENFQLKTAHLPANCQFITMCAKGYRSQIGYSFMKLTSNNTWNFKLCKGTVEEIKGHLQNQKKSQNVSSL